jgi:hypothetical protein
MSKIFLKNSNNFNTRELFDSRQNYKNIYTNFNKKYQNILYDKFFETPFYGRIDSFGDSVFPSESSLKELNPKISNFLFVHDFVKDAFSEMDSYFRSGLLTNRLNNSGPYSSLIPRKTFSSVNKQYSDFLIKFNNAFFSYINNIYNKKNILNFKDYIFCFLNFLNEQPGIIIFTRSKFIQSNYCDPLTSGLSISLSLEGSDNDFNKLEIFLKDNNFPFFMESCKRHAFFIDKNSPWLINFDFNSPASIKYINKYNLKNKEEVFEKRFYKSFYTDLKIIKEFLHYSYNVYISSENKIDFVIDVDKCFSPVIEGILREPISIKNAQQDYSNFEWLKIYFDILLVEEKIVIKQSKYNQILLDLQNILKYGTLVDSMSDRVISSQIYLNKTIKLLKKEILDSDLKL